MLKQLNQPLNLKSVLKTVGLLCVVFGILGICYYGYRQAQSTIWYKKFQIRSYLKKNALKSNFKADFDFDIKTTIINLKADISNITNQIFLSNSNLTFLRERLSSLKKEREDLQYKLSRLKSKTSSLEESLLSSQRRLTNRQDEVTQSRSNVMMRTTTLEGLKKQADTLKAKGSNLTNEMTALKDSLAKLRDNLNTARSNYNLAKTELKQKNTPIPEAQQVLTNLDSQIADFRKNIDTVSKTILSKESELSNLRSEIANLNNTISEKENSLKNHSADLKTLETNLFNLQTNITGITENVLKSRREQLEIGRQIAENEKNQKDVQGQINKLTANLDDLRKKLVAQQRLLNAKEQEEKNQYAVFSRDILRKINEVSSYASYYQIIGQQLWTADKLLDSDSLEKKEMGIKIAYDAMRYALDYAQNFWLASRIVEAYLYPNIDILKKNEQNKQFIDQMLTYCARAFQSAEEIDNLIFNYKLQLENAINEKRANQVRYYLGSVYEQTGDYEMAIYYLKQISDKTNFVYAVRRASFLESRLNKLKKK